MTRIKIAYKNIILNADEMAASQVGRRKGGDEELFWLPVVCRARLYLAAADSGQLPTLCLHDFVLGYVLDSLEIVTIKKKIRYNKSHITSVRQLLVPFTVTLLWLSIVAQILMASPGTYPPLSSLTLQVTGPVVKQVIPSLCSISQWNGCWIWKSLSLSFRFF